MKLIADLHTHTYMSGHAYASAEEMARAAAQRGLKAIAITDHGPAMVGGPQPIYFYCLKYQARILAGIPVFRGMEANILSDDGKLDSNENMVRNLDFVMAGIHPNVTDTSALTDYTQGIVSAMEVPYIKIICHPDQGRLPLDVDAVVQAAHRTGKILEVNNHSLDDDFPGDALGSYKHMLTLCRQLDVPVVVNTDAHSQDYVGVWNNALPILEEINFPEELVVNASWENLEKYLGIKSPESI